MTRALDVGPHEWAEVRRDVLERDGYTCYLCGRRNASTCRRTVPGPWRSPRVWSAVCADCQLVTPAPERPRRQKTNRRGRATVENVGGLPVMRRGA